MPATIAIVGEPMVELRSVESGLLAWTFAGDTLNCAATVAATDPAADVRYLTGIGDDHLSERFLAFCEQLGIDASASTVVPGRQLGLYWVETDGDGRWFRYWRGESAARSALHDGVDVPNLGSGDVLVLSGITLAVAGTGRHQLLDQARAARSAGATVVYDPNHRPALWSDPALARAAHDAALAVSDWVLGSVDDVRDVWELDAADFARMAADHGATDVVVTDGPAEVLGLFDGTFVRVQPPTIDPVDPTGAGDAFDGSFLTRRLAGDPPRTAMRFACAAAARVVRSPGALTHLLEEPPCVD